jgi:hypothetical protein
MWQCIEAREDEWQPGPTSSAPLSARQEAGSRGRTWDCWVMLRVTAGGGGGGGGWLRSCERFKGYPGQQYDQQHTVLLLMMLAYVVEGISGP